MSCVPAPLRPTDDEKAKTLTMNPKPKRLLALRACYALAAILGIAAAAIAIPKYRKARAENWMRTCQETLTKYDGAKEQWALEHNKKPGDVVTIKDIIDDIQTSGTYYSKALPLNCPSGGRYIINPIGTAPICTSGLPGHSLSAIGVAIRAIE